MISVILVESWIECEKIFKQTKALVGLSKISSVSVIVSSMNASFEPSSEKQVTLYFQLWYSQVILQNFVPKKSFFFLSENLVEKDGQSWCMDVFDKVKKNSDEHLLFLRYGWVSAVSVETVLNFNICMSSKSKRKFEVTKACLWTKAN